MISCSAHIIGPDQRPADEHRASTALYKHTAVCRKVAIPGRVGRIRNGECHLRHGPTTGRAEKKFTRSMEP